MKKLVIVLIIILSVVPVSAATYQLVTASYPINVNGQKIAVEPLNYNGTTYLPLRAISEAIGVPIEWDGDSVEINTVDIEALKEACVMIYSAKNGKVIAQGSGVYIDYDEVLTAQHVIEGADQYGTLNEEFKSVVDQDDTVDAAILKSKSEVKPVKIGDSDEVQVGDKVIVISSPQGKDDVVSYHEILPSGNVHEFLITGDTISGGSSGGPVFNMQGELVAIMTSEADKWKFARPINEIRKAL